MLSLRNDIRMTQVDMGKVLGVSRHTVLSWEAGEKYPNSENLQRFIALAFEHGAFPGGKRRRQFKNFGKPLAKRYCSIESGWTRSYSATRQLLRTVPITKRRRRRSVTFSLTCRSNRPPLSAEPTNSRNSLLFLTVRTVVY
jgi:DNA-binding XRE family transcriptional regulator